MSRGLGPLRGLGSVLYGPVRLSGTRHGLAVVAGVKLLGCLHAWGAFWVFVCRCFGVGVAALRVGRACRMRARWARCMLVEQAKRPGRCAVYCCLSSLAASMAK